VFVSIKGLKQPHIPPSDQEGSRLLECSSSEEWLLFPSTLGMFGANKPLYCACTRYSSFHLSDLPYLKGK
jgi:hypothetical protein